MIILNKTVEIVKGPYSGMKGEVTFVDSDQEKVIVQSISLVDQLQPKLVSKTLKKDKLFLGFFLRFIVFYKHACFNSHDIIKIILSIFFIKLGKGGVTMIRLRKRS